MEKIPKYLKCPALHRKDKNDWEKQVNELHVKVQGTIEKKEEIIGKITAEYDVALEKIKQLEQLIQQQSAGMAQAAKKKK